MLVVETIARIRRERFVSRRGANASAADHLWMVCGDRQLEHSVLGELAGRSCGRCSRVLRLHAEAVAQRGRHLSQPTARLCPCLAVASLRTTGRCHGY